MMFVVVLWCCAVCCCLFLFVAVCCCLLLFVAVRCYPTLFDLCYPNLTQHKIGSLRHRPILLQAKEHAKRITLFSFGLLQPLSIPLSPANHAFSSCRTHWLNALRRSSTSGPVHRNFSRNNRKESNLYLFALFSLSDEWSGRSSPPPPNLQLCIL